MNDQANALRIFIEAKHRTPRGQLYAVRLGTTNGPVIVERSLDPEHAACRYLVEQGIKGRLEVWSAGRTAPRMIIRCIATAAGRTACDEDRKGVRLRKYQPPPLARVDAATAPSFGQLTQVAEAYNDNACNDDAEAG